MTGNLSQQPDPGQQGSSGSGGARGGKKQAKEKKPPTIRKSCDFCNGRKKRCDGDGVRRCRCVPAVVWCACTLLMECHLPRDRRLWRVTLGQMAPLNLQCRRMPPSKNVASSC